MGVLKAKQRNALPAKKFGLPGKDGKAKGSYPVNDKAHAEAAKGRATENLARGRLSPAQAAKIRHRADVVLGEVDSTYHHNGQKRKS